jgi:Zn-dependent protease
VEFNLDLQTLIFTIIGILISLSIHEFMHAWTGLKLGDTTAQEEGRISFNPLNHIDPILTVALPIITLLLFNVPILAAKPVPFDPRNVRWGEFGAAIIAFAGPLSNLIMATISALAVRFFFNDVGLISTFLILFTGLNVSIFVFNMMPVPPLDGSRILYAFSPEGVQRFLMQLENFGFVILMLLIVAVPAFSTILVNTSRSILLFLL